MVFRKEGFKSLIDVFGEERCKGGECSAESEKSLEQAVERVIGVFWTTLSL